ncbi:HD domain-containing protein [Treponema sp.]|uniref:HD domain-containing protein n=1 Tax=Treponema sp. TaxID=166 RepID=UPI003EFDF553
MYKDFTAKYHAILCREYPAFLKRYVRLPILSRLGGVGLLCGTDWTPLFHNSFFYSRLSHSIGTALIVWNFTGSKAQTIAALLHDVSTPAFSHVLDFKNGDALTQSSTENGNADIISSCRELKELLDQDGIPLLQVMDYHQYPVADNELPGLSADRLEYMYPSGASLDKIWTLREIQKNYSAIQVLENEKGIPELGFSDIRQGIIYTKKFHQTGMILQRNEDKIAMQLMADIISLAEKNGILKPEELYSLPESKIIERFTQFSKEQPQHEFSAHFRTFRGMKKIIRSSEPIEGFYCVSLSVKRRYINPLVMTKSGAKRICQVSDEAKNEVERYLQFNDTNFGCVEFL